MPERLTGSRLPIAEHCAWAFRADAQYPRRPSSPEAERGTSFHECAASFVDTGSWPAMSPSFSVMAQHFEAWWGKRPHAPVFQAEVSFFLDPARTFGFQIGARLGRDYSRVPPEAIPMTCDWFGMDDGFVVYGDLKTGFAGHVEPPDTNLQLLSGAAAAFLQSPGARGARIEIVHVDEEGIYPRIHYASPLQLHSTIQRILEIQNRVATARATAGAHCKFCPALGACPETQEVVLRTGFDAKARWTTEYVSEENDALLLDEMKALEKILKEVDITLKARARERGGIRTVDGKLWKPVVSRRTGIDKLKVETMLGERYAEVLTTTEFESFRRCNA